MAAPPGSAPARGFTLIELLVVLLILGMATAVVAPTLRPPGSGAARAAAELAAAYAKARSTAVGRGLAVAVHVEPATGRYTVLAEPAPGAAPDTIRAGALRLPRGASLRASAAGRAVVVFEPLGRARGGRITIEQDGRSYAVYVDVWTAEPRVLAR